MRHGATSERDMEVTRQIEDGRRKMRQAFIDLSDIAGRLGINEDDRTRLQGLFFDGNQAINEALSRLRA